ncbi:phosphoribosylamine--glycine ligase [Pseudohoeflea coraliihabitans]|uniref:Phosphoribosylamine--glycine ligase n=1 Tax=Pseudohoeflea coraliihabitans TaxID=2860393 RepID=A0ABS6WMT0_9HYPH|nr:phosphoribosylamine--glycine ligase [Pseudohoeflea sp. DP4N28-3]MBW3096963.1 phosphoribosylamine--glycine ligase [Pseudohoeflea sp. DP4N28-3]
MNVLLIGSGGREHALAWKLKSSPRLRTLFIAPGNPGTAACGENVALDASDHGAIVSFCRERAVALVVIGPEAPLVDGLADSLKDAGVAVFGPSAAAAQLEGSKGFTKDLCARYDIPTAAYQRFNNAPKAKNYLRQTGAPIVIKADGLAAGKGVTVAMSEAEALAAIDDCFEGAFGDAGTEVVVEEFLTGEEVSFFCVCDGDRAVALTSAQDHKRVGDGDSGPNTGGMGAYSPAPVMDAALIRQTMDAIIAPTMRGMAEMGHPFTGVLYAGLMLTADGPKLIEYNVRFGDPECQVLLPRLRDDLLALLDDAAHGRLEETALHWRAETALSVVLAAEGYPMKPRKGGRIDGISEAEKDGALVFHAGTRQEDGVLTAAGGRVLNVTALGETVSDAQAAAYRAVDLIDFPEGFCRRDIGWREVERERS